MRAASIVLFITALLPAIARAGEPLTPAKPIEAVEPLFDWSLSRQYRSTVLHPSLTIKPADVARAKENIRRYAWAKTYAEELNRRAGELAEEFTPGFAERMLEATTPLSTIFTPCPACRDQGRIWHPQGRWTWSAKSPEQIKRQVCGTVFPSAKYPETIAIHSTGAGTGGTPQTFTFVGGEPFVVFGYKTGRPSLSGCIRASKVNYMADSLDRLGEAYLLSGDVRFARAARIVLLRLAAVYPHWLVHSGYGELADTDSRTAAANIAHLPQDELVYPPNIPDRALHTGYWTAGRATGHGQESYFLRRAAEAYDATCEAKDGAGAPVCSDAERLRIEENVLLEGSILLVADKGINNKSVGNRAAAGMIGIVCGHPQLVRFGLDGFHKTINDWFLPDGGTPESPSYAMMTFGNTRDLPLAMRDYADPPGYHDADGKRLDHVDLFHEPAYIRAWSAMIDGLQGDCTLVPYADTYAGRKIDSQWADLLAANYPDRPQYLALLKTLCGDDLKDANAAFAIYYREPGLETKPSPPLAFPDICLPDLRIGQMRTGADGRESLLALSASHWGSHHHLDSLNLYYWKDGHELLGDLGYLWDNPEKHMTARTLAHNTVILDEADQRSKDDTGDRGGDVQFFKTSEHVKVMRASSSAYADTKRYQRTSAIIDHGDGKNYVVDFFEVEGGTTQDYVFHGPGNDFSADLKAADAKLYDLKNVRTLTPAADGVATISWKLDDDVTFTARLLAQQSEQIFIGDGWGQRDPFNKDAGATLPYVIRRTRGPVSQTFVSLFECNRHNHPFVKNIARAGDQIAVETADGVDYIQSDRGFVVKGQSGGTHWTFQHEQ